MSKIQYEDANNCLLTFKIISHFQSYCYCIDVTIGILSENNIDELYIDIERFGFPFVTKHEIKCYFTDDFFGPRKNIIVNKNQILNLKHKFTIHKIKKILNIKNKMKKIERYAYNLKFTRCYSMIILDYDKYANKEDEYKKKLKKYIKKLFKPQVVPFKKELLYKYRKKNKNYFLM